jgi:hypothetical protein
MRERRKQLMVVTVIVMVIGLTDRVVWYELT